MSNVSKSSELVKAKLMEDKEFAQEYARLKPRYEIISQIIAERHKQNLTQQELAERIGTNKTNISRFESGTYNPSLDFLAKLVQGLGKDIELSIVDAQA